jgi:hypothetical protein
VKRFQSAITKYTIALCPVGKRRWGRLRGTKNRGEESVQFEAYDVLENYPRQCVVSSRKYGTAHSSHLHRTYPRTYLTLKMGLQRCTETSDHKLRTDSKQRSGRALPQLHCSKDLYPRMGAVFQVRSYYIVWNLKSIVNKSKTLKFKKRAGIKQNERLFTTKQQERHKI